MTDAITLSPMRALTLLGLTLGALAPLFSARAEAIELDVRREHERQREEIRRQAGSRRRLQQRSDDRPRQRF